MAHYPGAQKPKATEVPRIERDDFPAPPFPYTDPERRRRWSGGSGSTRDATAAMDAADEIDGEFDSDEPLDDPRLRKEEAELSKIASGIGKVFLKTVKEREKVRAWRRANMDPRNASRAPNARSEVHQRLRYNNPVNACKFLV